MKNEMIEKQILDAAERGVDLFDYIYECISGNHGLELAAYVADLYNDTMIENGLHPDDDFEEIINHLLDDLGV